MLQDVKKDKEVLIIGFHDNSVEVEMAENELTQEGIEDSVLDLFRVEIPNVLDKGSSEIQWIHRLRLYALQHEQEVNKVGHMAILALENPVDR